MCNEIRSIFFLICIVILVKYFYEMPLSMLRRRLIISIIRLHRCSTVNITHGYDANLNFHCTQYFNVRLL